MILPILEERPVGATVRIEIMTKDTDDATLGVLTEEIQENRSMTTAEITPPSYDKGLPEVPVHVGKREIAAFFQTGRETDVRPPFDSKGRADSDSGARDTSKNR